MFKRLLIVKFLFLSIQLILAVSVNVGGQIFSGAIIANSSANLTKNLVLISTHNRQVKAYDFSGNQLWTTDLDSDYVFSTGAHVYWESRGWNFLVVSPLNGKDAELIMFDSNTATEVMSGTSKLGDEIGWGDMYGSVASFVASETSSAMFQVIAGIDEVGKLYVSIYKIIPGPPVAISSGDKEIRDVGYSSYSSLAIGGFSGPSDTGNVRIFAAADEYVYVYEMSWDVSGTFPNLTLTELASSTVNGKIQSGFALDSSAGKVYFIANNISGSKFYVMDWDGTDLTGYNIPGYFQITNSPVIDSDGRVYIVSGKTIFYYESGRGLELFNTVPEDVYAAPVIGDDGELYVVTEHGKVYRVSSSRSELISSECFEPNNLVYSPPIIRGGKLVFGDYDGRLCIIDLTSLGNVDASGGRWPAFNRSDGRTAVSDYNPPYSVSLRLKAFLLDNTSLDGLGIEATYTHTGVTDYSTVTFDTIVSVPYGGTATVCALDYFTEQVDPSFLGGIFSGLETVHASYSFSNWDTPFYTTDRCVSDAVVLTSNWNAKYGKYYKVLKVLVNTVDNTLLATESTWVEVGDSIELNPFSGRYEFERWDIYSATNLLDSTTVEEPVLTVSSPILAVEYAQKVFGTVQWEFPEKVVLNWGSASETFLSTLTLNEVVMESSPAKVFYIRLTLPDDFKILDASRVINLSYPTNVSTETGVNVDYPIIIDNTNFEYMLSVSTPVLQATDIVQITLTIEYTSDATLTDLFSKDMITAYIETPERVRGLITVNIVPQPVPMPEYPLGDFNRDKMVDEVDLSMLADHYGTREGEEDWDPVYDIGPRDGFVPPDDYNGGPYNPGVPRRDGKIDYEDLFILAHMYGYRIP